MNTQAPSLYYSSSGGYYYVVADWGWLSDGWKTDAGLDYGHIGGTDAAGVWFSKPINNLNGAMSICGAHFGGSSTPACWNSSSYKGNNQYGESIQFQDQASNSAKPYAGKTDADRGSLVFPFKWLSSGCQQFGNEYDHDWSSTSITGMSISASGIGVSWSSSSHHWEDVSAVSHFDC
jgi:hypothetical protein